MRRGKHPPYGEYTDNHAFPAQILARLFLSIGRKEERMTRVELNGEWQLSYQPQRQKYVSVDAVDWNTIPTIPAVVPGNVELDLMRAGVLPELSVGNNIYLLREYETYEWWYRKQFVAPAPPEGHTAELVFEGLDCLAQVWLNGVLVGEAANMLIPHRFDVTSALQAGENELVVRIRSAVLEGRERTPAPFESALPCGYESLTVRKPPHCYGWDIMPRVVSAGIWRDVYLQFLPPTRWRTVYWATTAVDPPRRSAVLFVDWDFTTDQHYLDDWQVRLRLSREGTVAHESLHPVFHTHGRAQLHLQGVDLWYPRGYGEPALYEASAELLDGQGNVLDIHRCRLGIRTVELRRTDITTPEEPGEFVFVVNGVKVFAKGTNWVPLDAFHSRDIQHVQPTVEMLLDLNCNMVRCWGGNVYESDRFFDLCDEHGIMVWQDFALACAIYPDEIIPAMKAEAEQIVRRLRNHPCLVLWCGNNEIDHTYFWTGTGIDPNTDKISRQVLAEVVRQLDPFRPYLPSSPYVSEEVIRRGGDTNLTPEQHLWGPRDDFKGPTYTYSLAHFVSEIGYHGCPDRRTLEQMMEPEYLWHWQGNEQWLTHATRPLPRMTDFNYRIPLMAKQIAVLFDAVPDNLDDFILASQISQAEALKFFIERWRQRKWRTTGILWWNLRDGWPIISDAIVDYYYRKKLAYVYVQRVQTDVCAMLSEPEAGMHTLIVVNDTLQPAEGQVEVVDAESDLLLLAAAYHVEPNDKSVVGAIPQISSPALWLIRWRDEQGREYLNHYLAGNRPFRLQQYRQWLQLLRIPEDIGSVWRR
ncbi:MAG: glycoside hydrolase family 2 TIM barrel-domain containing protein [Armatimonadota bacterium]|nr:glycoside hydrolase family 2 TIM barrel-domain containing protein [Armatimonadota bacterium]